ncbi:PAS domain S-box protein [bacterium]|nr:PAS domain S-box protein [bacterium]
MNGVILQRQNFIKHNMHFLLAGLGFGLFYWIMESVRDVIIFGNENIFHRIFMPDPIGFWTRALVVFIIILFGARLYKVKEKQTMINAVAGLKNMPRKVIGAGVGSIIIYWVIESFRDAFVFHKATFIHALIFPSPMDFWMRSLVILILILFAVYAHLLLKSEAESSNGIKAENDEMAQLIEKKTAHLIIANKKLSYEIKEREEAEKEVRTINRFLRMLSKGNKSLVQAEDEFNLVNAVCNIIIDIGGYQAVWAGYVNDGSIRVISQAGRINMGNANENRILEEFVYNPAREAIQRQKPVFLYGRDIEFQEFCEYCGVEMSVQSLISIPLSCGGMNIGVLTIFTNRKDAFSGHELSIIQEMSDDLAFGISILRKKEEHALVERNLHENEKKYRTLTENIHAGIFRTSGDLEERFIEINNSYVKIFGYSGKEELFALSASKLYINEAEHSRLRSKLSQYGEVTNEEVQLRRKDGAVIWASVTATAVMDNQGNITYIDGVLEDITEKKLAASQLQRSEEKYRLIVENTGEGIVHVDLNENFTYANAACEKIFGVPPHSLIGMNMSDFVDEDTFRVIRSQTMSRREGKIGDYEIEIIRPSGEIRNVLITATPQHGEDGRIVAGFGIIRDITDRKRVEVELVRVNRALKTLSAGNMALVRASGEKDLLNNVSNILVEVGGYQQTWTGFLSVKDGEECFDNFVVTGKTKDFISSDCLSLKDLQKDRNPVTRAYNDKKAVVVKYDNIEMPERDYYRQALKLGFKVSIHLPLFDKDKVIGILNIYSDELNAFDNEEVKLLEEMASDLAFGITVQRNKIKHEKMTEEKDKIHAQLIQAQKMEAIGILAGGIAHDFNNMLTAIQVSTEVTLMEIDENSTLYEDLSEIHKLTDKAADFIRQLMLFSRKHPMEMKTIDINNSITNLNKMLHRIIGEDIDVRTNLQDDLWAVKADLGTMEQVVMNLSVNARDAMPNGGVLDIKTENVTLEESDIKDIPEARAGSFVCLSVSDTGMGMDKETMQHIFEPFFSTKGVGKGTGLGLSVVYGIMKQHNGWINVDSVPGEGTCFKVYLPSTEQAAEADVKKKISINEFNGRGKKILLVEDEEKVRESTCYGLNRSGYRVFSAGSAQEAKEVFIKEQGDFNLILSDVVLPDKSGLELVSEFLSLNPDLKILISSGYTDQKVRWPEISEKGYRFLEKPYALRELLRVVEEIAA